MAVVGHSTSPYGSETGWGWVRDTDARTGACEIVLTRGKRTRVDPGANSCLMGRKWQRCDCKVVGVGNDLSLKSRLALSRL